MRNKKAECSKPLTEAKVICPRFVLGYILIFSAGSSVIIDLVADMESISEHMGKTPCASHLISRHTPPVSYNDSYPFGNSPLGSDKPVRMAWQPFSWNAFMSRGNGSPALITLLAMKEGKILRWWIRMSHFGVKCEMMKNEMKVV